MLYVVKNVMNFSIKKSLKKQERQIKKEQKRKNELENKLEVELEIQMRAFENLRKEKGSEEWIIDAYEKVFINASIKTANTYKKIKELS